MGHSSTTTTTIGTWSGIDLLTMTKGVARTTKEKTIVHLKVWNWKKDKISFRKEIVKKFVLNENFYTRTEIEGNNTLRNGTIDAENILNTIATLKEIQVRENIDMLQFEPEWQEIKENLIIGYDDSNGIATFNEIDNHWTLCSWITKWDSNVPIWSTRFSSSKNQFRICCKYELLGLEAIIREPEPFKDYIPTIYINGAARKIDTGCNESETEHGDLQEDDGCYNEERDNNGTDIETEAITMLGRQELNLDEYLEDTIVIDLGTFSSDSYHENCTLIKVSFFLLFFSAQL